MRSRWGLIAAVLVSAAFAGSAHADDKKAVSIIVMNDTPQLLEVKDGLVRSLAKHGWTDGKTLTISRSGTDTQGKPFHETMVFDKQ